MNFTENKLYLKLHGGCVSNIKIYLKKKFYCKAQTYLGSSKPSFKLRKQAKIGNLMNQS